MGVELKSLSDLEDVKLKGQNIKSKSLRDIENNSETNENFLVITFVFVQKKYITCTYLHITQFGNFYSRKKRKEISPPKTKSSKRHCFPSLPGKTTGKIYSPALIVFQEARVFVRKRVPESIDFVIIHV